MTAPSRLNRDGASHQPTRRAGSRVSAFLHGLLVSPLDRANRVLAARPGIDYLMIRIAVFSLTAFGVVMVLSASMTWSILEGSNVWGAALRQTSMVVLGLAAFWLFLRVHPDKVRRAATVGVGLATILLVLVLTPLGTGREEVGSQSWIAVGFIRFQPSEFAKVAIALFGANRLADQEPNRSGWESPYTLFGGVALCHIALLYLEGDLGMAISYAIVVVFVMIFAGVHRGWIWGAMGSIGAVLLIVMAGGGYRSNRIHVFLEALRGRFDDTQGDAFQSHQGFLSLGDGGFGGVGLGQSRAKWFYLPEARNDFIFAIVGEELGFLGAVVVIFLFAVLAFFGLRTALRAQNNYQSLLAATLAAGVVSQAFINVGYVIGILPVTGIQLPMISAGGTSAIITLATMGLLANVARHEPEAVSSVQATGRPIFDRLFFIPEPISSLDVASPVRFPRRSDPGRARFGTPITGRPLRQGGLGREAAVQERRGGQGNVSRDGYDGSSAAAERRTTRRANRNDRVPREHRTQRSPRRRSN